MSTINIGTSSTTAFKVESDTTGALLIKTGASPTLAMTVDANQNVGIGVTPSAWSLGGYVGFEVGALGTGLYNGVNSLNLVTNAYYNSTWKYAGNYAATAFTGADGKFIWSIAASGTAGNTITWSEVMSITSARQFYFTGGGNGALNMFFQNDGNSNPYGVRIRFSAASPNNGTSYFLNCIDSGPTDRLVIYSNGGIANFSANNSNLSDRSVKKDETPFDPDKSWAFGLRMENAWMRFKYIDQTHDDFNNGYIAQLVQEAAGNDFPELVEPLAGASDTPRLHVYDNDLMHIMGYIVTLCQKKIESLEAEVAALKGAK